jgi:C4-type Zn-finger protein
MEEVIQNNMTEQTEEHCPVCRKVTKFAYTESPSGFKVCTECGYRVTNSKLKMVIESYGYTFREER